jgi:hypothetical protein
MIFAGLIVAYVVVGWLYSTVTNSQFTYAIPFIFVVQGLILAFAISVLWYLIFTEAVFKKLRYSIRLISFVLVLVLVLTGFLATFFVYHTDWAKLWLIVAGLFVLVTAGISVLGEIYFKITGKRYTQLLNNYKENILTGKN